MLTSDQGARLVGLARQAIEADLAGREFALDDASKTEFGERKGCFVTLRIGEELRGCIGYPEPIMPLWEAVTEAARGAMSKDPRFYPLQHQELPGLIVEVEVLTDPVRLTAGRAEDYLPQIRVGRDGLFLRTEKTSGLLLPQVAPRHGWDALAFLRQTCHKAFLEPDAWRDMDQVQVYTFQCQGFVECRPRGEVIPLSVESRD